MTARRNPAGRASLPPTGYRRPVLADPDSLTVRVVGEDGQDNGTHTFCGLDAPPLVVAELVASFSRRTGSGGSWRSRASARNGAGALRRFAGHLGQLSRPPERIEEITAGIWNDYRTCLRASAAWPQQTYATRTLLAGAEGLTDEARWALARPMTNRRRRKETAYSLAEFRRIRVAAWQTLNAATPRIRAGMATVATVVNVATTAADEDAGAAPSDVARLLAEVARTGCLPHATAQRQVQMRSRLGPGVDHYWKHLFLDNAEVFAIMVLFACERGYNASVTGRLRANAGHPDGHGEAPRVRTVELHKPRRPASGRFTSNNLVGSAPSSEGHLFDIAVELTAPARATLAHLGRPTDRLLVARSAHPKGGGLFIERFEDEPKVSSAGARWNARAGLQDDAGDAMSVSLRRLRLTEQVLNGQPRQNAQSTHDNIYRLHEPTVHEASAATILRGAADALGDARLVATVRTLTGADLAAARADPPGLAARLGVGVGRARMLLDGRLDTVTAGCLDFHNGPVDPAGDPCRASFLLCLGCPNAVVTSEHFPRLVYLHDALGALAAAVAPAVWDSDYAVHYQRLSALLDAHLSTVERDDARAHADPQDRRLIDDFLSRRYDS